MSLSDTVSRIKERFAGSVLDVTEFAGETTLHVRGSHAFDILKTLKEEGFNFLADLTALDLMTMGGFERFAVVYHLLSLEKVQRLVVKAYVAEENPSIPSVESLWKAADWQEREVYDLFGIAFEGHPDLRRILNPDDYEGHPLRKDYPREGRGERIAFPVVQRETGAEPPKTRSS
ncbi:MAG: NADH-quinone oxidoreductase subunit C [Fidelibacterota bacterium]